jgi:hypothetical protein
MSQAAVDVITDVQGLITEDEKAREKARQALTGASDEQLAKPWKLMVAGRVVSEDPRHVVIRDTFMHLSHHRGEKEMIRRRNNIRERAARLFAVQERARFWDFSSANASCLSAGNVDCLRT